MPNAVTALPNLGLQPTAPAAIMTGAAAEAGRCQTMHKFRHTIKLDDHSGASVDILVDEDGLLSVRAVDLIGDAWHQSLESISRAEEYREHDRRYEANREIQTGLTKLATHLDGVVYGLCECLKRQASDFTPPAYGRRRDCTLRQKIEYIETYVRETRGVTLPNMDLSFKVIRDLLIHPYANKSLRSGPNQELAAISQGDIFDIDVDDLKTAVSVVDRWLGDVTKVFEYPRGYDTRRLAEDFAAKLAGELRRSGSIQSTVGDIPVKTYRI